MKWILLVALFPVVAEGQVQRKPVIKPAMSAVISGPFAPLWQLGAGVRYGDWSYEARYGGGVPIGPNVGWATFRSFALYARSDVSDIFYWMVGAMYASYKHTTPYLQPDFHSTILYEYTWHSITPAIGLGVGYKYIFLELQAYYPGALVGIRVGVN
ncbi:MAG: hypothetical protein M1395_08840 [Bacteroidetes bacterium]|nr:hypothetical protein [Bacteroidota bacterium]